MTGLSSPPSSSSLELSSLIDDAPNSDPVVVTSWSLLDSSTLPIQTETTSSFETTLPTPTRKRKKKISAKYVYSSDSDPENPSKHLPPEKLKRFKCDKCPYLAAQQSILNRHLAKHDLTISKGKLKCPSSGCPWTAFRMETLDQHLDVLHGIKVEVDTFNFNNEEAANHWINSMEETTYAKYRNKSRNVLPWKVRLYYCNRSQQFKVASKGKGLRTRRRRDSITGDCLCPSRIVVTKIETGVELKHFKTHLGHTLGPYRVSSSGQIRRNMRKKLRKQQALQASGSTQSDLQETHTSETSPNLVDFSIQDEELDEEGYQSLAVEYFNNLLKLAKESQSSNVLVNILRTGFVALEQQKNRSTNNSI